MLGLFNEGVQLLNALIELTYVPIHPRQVLIDFGDVGIYLLSVVAHSSQVNDLGCEFDRDYDEHECFENLEATHMRHFLSVLSF